MALLLWKAWTVDDYQQRQRPGLGGCDVPPRFDPARNNGSMEARALTEFCDDFSLLSQAS